MAEHDESTLTLRKYLRLDNLSGETFGTSGVWAGFGNYFHPEIGLQEAKQMPTWKFSDIPIKKSYTFDWWACPTVPDQPEQRYVEMRYVLTNDAKHNLGAFPLQFGKVRIFQKDGRGGEVFIGKDWGQFTPIDDQMKLYLGLARDVVVKRKVTNNVRHPVHGNLYHQEIQLEYTMENFKKDALTLDIVEDMNRLRNELCGAKGRDAEWEIERRGTSLGEAQIERKDAKTVVFHVPLPAAPQGEAKVEPVVVTVRLFLRNEW